MAVFRHLQIMTSLILLCILINNGMVSGSRIIRASQVQEEPQPHNGYSSIISESDRSSDAADSSILLTQVVFRHGDRSPTHSYPNDPHIHMWPQGLGQLTTTGMNQAYQLGTYLRYRYKAFLGKDYKQKEVYIRSTNMDRTLMTAECVASGLFPLSIDNNDNVTSSWPLGAWQPIPVQTVPEEDDNLLHAGHACEFIKDFRKRIETLYSEEQNLIHEKELMFNLSQHTGMDINVTSLHFLADIVFCEKTHNLSQPEWMTPETEEVLMDFSKHRAKLTLEDASYLSGTLLHTIIHNMIEKATNETDEHKIYLYSAHDSTVGPLLSLLGADDQIQVPYTAALIIELHKVGGEYSVEFFYRNDTTVPPYRIVPQCSTNGASCSLHSFHTMYIDRILNDEKWDDLCRNTEIMETNLQKNLIPLLVAVFVALIGLNVFLMFKAYKYWQQNPAAPQQEQYTLLQAEVVSSDSETDFNHDSDDNTRSNSHTYMIPQDSGVDEQKYEQTTIN